MAHASGIGQLHPFDGVDIHAQIPGIHRVRVALAEQGKVANHHQALDVVGVGVAQALCQRQMQAAHARVAGPEHLRQRVVIVQLVQLAVFRHGLPVHATHILAPAQNLAHKALDLRQTDLRGLLLKLSHGGVDDFCG